MKTFTDKTPQAEIGTDKMFGSAEPFGEIFCCRYMAAHIHPDGRLGISGLGVAEIERHAKIYGGGVRYGWNVIKTEQV